MSEVYGFKVSKPGHDVKTAADKDLIMSSELNMLKTAGFGNLAAGNNQAHGLSYVPIYFAVNKVVGTMTRYSACWGTQNVGVNGTNLNNGSSNEIRYYYFHQEAR